MVFECARHLCVKQLKCSLIADFVLLIILSLFFFLSDSTHIKPTCMAEFREVLFEAAVGCCKGRVEQFFFLL